MKGENECTKKNIFIPAYDICPTRTSETCLLLLGEIVPKLKRGITDHRPKR